jgi:uncharacterized protein (TIGR02246 family)
MSSNRLVFHTYRSGPGWAAFAAATLACAVLLSARQTVIGADSSGLPGAATSKRPADEGAIRRLARDYEAACNAKDAKAVGELFAPESEVVQDNGYVVHGRDAIAAAFAQLFADNPKAKTKVEIESIRFVAPEVAIEDGITKTTPAPGEPPALNRYCVTHVKIDGHWLMASARDLDPEGRAIPVAERLKPLEFLIGDWIDESSGSVVASSYRWADGHKFIDQKFSVRVNDSKVLHGTQRIGWDGQAKAIKSWIFEDDGGHAEGTWAWDGKRWIVKVSGVGADGSTESATQAFTPVTNNSFDYESIHRIIDGVPAPNLFAHVVRRPPQAKAVEGGSHR